MKGSNEVIQVLQECSARAHRGQSSTSSMPG